jgi:hypothetical protein
MNETLYETSMSSLPTLTIRLGSKCFPKLNTLPYFAKNAANKSFIRKNLGDDFGLNEAAKSEIFFFVN